MAVSYVPPPNALMMTGDNGKMLAVHGDKKLGVFPYWYWMHATTYYYRSGTWGKYSVDGQGTFTDSWMEPWGHETEAPETSGDFMRIKMPRSFCMSREEDETPSEFHDRIPLAETLYDVKFVYTDDVAFAENPHIGVSPCEQVLPGYIVCTALLDSKAKDSIVEEHGDGNYIAAFAIKKPDPGKRFWAGTNQNVIDWCYAFEDVWGMASLDNIAADENHLMGCAVYKKNKGPLRISKGRISVELDCPTDWIKSQNPAFTNEINFQRRITLGFGNEQDYIHMKGSRNLDWSNIMGVLGDVSGSPWTEGGITHKEYSRGE